MAVLEPPKALGPCPTDEELAAFLDHMLPAAERARIMAHLADCERCLEIFTGAVRFQQETSGIDGGEGNLLPFPGRSGEEGRRVPRSGGWQWGVIAASAALAVGLGWTGYRLFLSDPASQMDAAMLVQPIAGRQGLTADGLFHGVFRGEPGKSLSLDAPAFMLGVHLVDLHLSLALGQTGDAAASHLKEMSADLKQVTWEESMSKDASDDATALERQDSSAARLRIAKRWKSRETELDQDLTSFPFGKWAEAGRLAAVTRTPDFFTRRANRRYLNKLLEEKEPIEEDAVPELNTIRRIWERGRLEETDYKALAESFDQIVATYRALASSSDS